MSQHEPSPFHEIREILRSLGSTAAPPGDDTPDPKTKAEIANLDARTERLQSDTKLREEYAWKAYGFLVAWTLFAGSILALSRFVVPLFDVSDEVLMTLIGGTTIAVISVFHSVIKGLFPKDKAE